MTPVTPPTTDNEPAERLRLLIGAYLSPEQYEETSDLLDAALAAERASGGLDEARLIGIVEGLVAVRHRKEGGPCYEKIMDMALFDREAWNAAYDALESYYARLATPQPGEDR